MDTPGSSLHHLALPGNLIQPLALDPQGREHGRYLLQVACEPFVCFLLEVFQGHVLPRQCVYDVPIGIIGVRGLTQPQGACNNVVL